MKNFINFIFTVFVPYRKELGVIFLICSCAERARSDKNLYDRTFSYNFDGLVAVISCVGGGLRARSALLFF